MAFRRSTRSHARRQDEPMGDFQANQGMQYHDVGGEMQGLGIPAGTPWNHPSTEGFLTQAYQYAQQQQQYHHHPYGHQQYYSHGQHPQQYYHHGHGEAASYHQYHQQHEEPSTSSGRTLRTRPAQPSSQSQSQLSSSTSNTSMSEKRRKMGSSGSKPGTSKDTGASHVQESAAEDIEDDENDTVEATGSQSQKKKSTGGMETNLTVDQMVHNCLYYFLLQQHKKVPVKKSDLVKNALNSQYKQFHEVMGKLEKIVNEVFGMKMIRLLKNKDNILTLAGEKDRLVEEPPQPVPGTSQGSDKGKKGNAAGKGKGYSSTECYILVSKYPSHISDSVMRRDPEADSKKTVLYLMLCTIFMLNRPIEEELIWKIIHEMKLDQLVCENRQDLRKFLKSEFVSSGYLTMEQEDKTNPILRMKRANEEASAANEKGDNADENSVKVEDYARMKYSWGPRAQVEYLKYPMLKFISARFPGRQPYEFTVQYNMIKKTEKELIDKDYVEERENYEHTDEGKNGSALQVKQKAGGSGETYSIDGDQAETETETEDQ